MGERAERAVARLEDERAETLRRLLGIDEAACRTPVRWSGREQSVNQLLRLFTSHTLDHFQHLHRLLQARGREITEAQLLLMKAEAAQAEFTALVMSLTDAEFVAQGPKEGDWSAEQILDHVIGNERRYREAILGAVASPQEAPAPSRRGP